ncbi:MAG TPA: MBL fold metallo-hydrolase, partial [Armatimonadota bacterium]|nr:MBL fold metallo-hydrolase [Armatimonadota bacterium]
MQLIFLGTGAGAPTRNRHLPSLALRRAGTVFLFDCGEGTQMQLQETAVRPRRIAHICISHLHGDHVLGLPGLLMSLQLGGREMPLAIHGPLGIAALVRETLRLTGAMLAFPLQVSEHAGAEQIAHADG